MSQTENVVVDTVAKEASSQAPTNSLVKLEHGVEVKIELTDDCGLCGNRSNDVRASTGLVTRAGSSLGMCLRRYAQINPPRCICSRCLELIETLETADLEFRRLRDEFTAILANSPLATEVKTEVPEDIQVYYPDIVPANDSDDEPLAFTKKKRKIEKKKKKVAKHKLPKSDDFWECNVCGMQGSGGIFAETTHKLTSHDMVEANAITNIKKEGEDGSESQQYSNGFDSIFKMEDDDEDGFNEDDDFFLESVSKSDSKNSKLKKVIRRSKGEKRNSKTVYPCDECNSKYTSEERLARHKSMKHECGKPPFICEICGAHYKHKRACDIHIAMHKGISDWKCEECNKLFPSKGALARHNNIHTGKLNYQCDLCGKSFIHTSSFKMHKLSHSGVKPHSCSVCGLALLTRSHLQRHLRVHSGEKKHECDVCGKRFSERYNLLAHSKMHHDNATNDAATAPAPTLVSNSELRRKVFRCHFCPERFERRYMLERHMGVIHGRTLERPPPTPRNTMSKLLKLQANKSTENNAETKQERSPEPKLSCVSNVSATGSATWDFAPRPNFSH